LVVKWPVETANVHINLHQHITLYFVLYGSFG
jgi:hypothetical protein